MNALETIAQLTKALEAGNYDTAPSKLVQGAALMVEDLSNAVELTTYDDKHIILQKEFNVESSKSVLAQFDRQLSYGGDFSHAAQFEGQVGSDETSDYVRITFPMCFYSHTRKVSIPSMMVQTVDGKKSDERAAADAFKFLAGAIEYDLPRGRADFSNAGIFDGNPGAMAPSPSMTGIDVQVRQSDIMQNAQDLMFNEFGSDESVVINGGSNLTEENIEDAWTRTQIHFGQAELLLLDPVTQSGYNKQAHGKERIYLSGSPQQAVGASVDRQWTWNGTVKLKASNFLRGKSQPSRPRLNGPGQPTLASATSVTVAGVVTGFLAGQVYKFTVTAANAIGEGIRSATSSVTVAADGDTMSVVIQPVTGAAWYNVYRSVAGGSQMKYIGRVAAAVAGNTTFTDLGGKIPGFVTGLLLDTTGFLVKELAPFSRLKLAVTQLAQPEAYFRFLSVGSTAPRKSSLIDNLR